jgi:hypothetical protein
MARGSAAGPLGTLKMADSSPQVAPTAHDSLGHMRGFQHSASHYTTRYKDDHDPRDRFCLQLTGKHAKKRTRSDHAAQYR